MKQRSFTRLIAVLLTLATFLSVVAPLGVFADSPEIWDGSIASGFASGTGTQSDPYIIKTGAQLAYLSQTVNAGTTYEGKYFKLGNDIVLNDTTNWESWEASAPKNKWTAIGGWISREFIFFSGSFDGDEHTISGIYTNDTFHCQGLFGCIDNSTIQNLGVIKSYIKGNENIGGVVGANNSGVVKNCYNTGTISGSHSVGGMVGRNFGTVESCYNTGTISGSSSVGGVVGISSITVANCYNTGVINGESDVGGVVGYIAGTVENCYNTGSVNGTFSRIGGVVGETSYYGTIENCCNTGAVSGEDSVGGVVGDHYSGTVKNCYNTGAINSTRGWVGGVVGKTSSYGTVQNCYNAGTVNSTDRFSGGVVGQKKSNTVENCYYLTGCAKDGNNVAQYGIGSETKGQTSADVSGKTKGLTAAQMKKKENFVGFDFETVWTIGKIKDYDYPTLQWQETIEFPAPHTHSYTTVVTPPTCTEKGYTTHTCTCGDSYKDTYTDPLGHNYKATVTPPTKTEKGYTTHTCTRCKDSYVDSYTDPIGTGGTVVEKTKIGNSGLYWEFKDGTLTITGSGAMPEFDLSGSKAPWSGIIAEIRFLVIGSGVTNVGAYAFYGCTALLSVSLPDTVLKIGDRAFYRCILLVVIILPSKLVSIGNEAFFRCEALSELTVGNKLQTIGEGAFENCISLTEISLPKSVTSIGKRAFCGCTSITAVVIPGKVVTIGDETFSGCSSLQTVTVPGSVVTIGEKAFYDCIILIIIILPDSVKTVGGYAFGNCRALKAVSMLTKDPSGIAPTAFSGCPATMQVSVPKEAEAAYEKALPSVSAQIVGSKTLRGDANGDGRINAMDYALIKSYVLGTNRNFTPEQLVVMDVNYDGVITSVDYALVKAIVLGSYKGS